MTLDLSNVDFIRLREALEVSWQPDTAYDFAEEDGNPALGQCYVTSRVVQHYFPECEIVEGEVETANGTEVHFWNIADVNGLSLHIDLTWQQFPTGSRVLDWKLRDRTTLNDSVQTVERFERMLRWVKLNLDASHLPST